MADATYQPKVYRKHGGDEFVVASGGLVTVESGGRVVDSDHPIVRHTRQRFTTAQVNAGATILAAIPGYKYRLCDMAMIAIGGAAATATSVDIIGTQSTSAVKLMDARVAGLTENTLLRAGTATNGLILAAGASFVANDANTAITIGKTGSNLATATHIDVLISYTIEPA